MESKKKYYNKANGYSLGFLLVAIGVFLMLYPGSFFPWIFLFPAIYYIPRMFLKGEFRDSFQCIVLFVGLFLMFYLKTFLPIIMIMIGVLVLFSIKQKKKDVI